MVAILAARRGTVKRGRSLRPPEPFLATAAIGRPTAEVATQSHNDDSVKRDDLDRSDV